MDPPDVSQHIIWNIYMNQLKYSTILYCMYMYIHIVLDRFDGRRSRDGVQTGKTVDSAIVIRVVGFAVR